MEEALLDAVHGRRLISKDMSFDDWLYLNYRTTPENLEKIMLSTGSHADYLKALDWYKVRYLRQLNNEHAMSQISMNEFMKNGGFNNGINNES